MPSGRMGIAWRVASVAGAFALLSVFVAGARCTGSRPRSVQALQLRGRGSLPLSGDLAAAGSAFRDGFEEGLRSPRDSLFQWNWEWSDNEGNPVETGAFLSSDDSGKPADLLLAGLSTAAADLPACRRACLVLGDGGEHRPDPLRWDLWTPGAVQRDRLLRLLRRGSPPRSLVVEATGAWTEPVFPDLRDSLPDLLVILHDPDNFRWDDAVQQILQLRPRTVLFWDSPSEASSLLSRRLAWPVLGAARLWVPEGTSLPGEIRADTLRPVWQALPGAASESWKVWGRRCGRALAESTRRKLADSLSTWTPAFARVRSDSSLETGPTGWFPRSN